MFPLMADLDQHMAGYYLLVRNIGMLDISENTVKRIDKMDLRGWRAGLFRSYYETLSRYGVQSPGQVRIV